MKTPDSASTVSTVPSLFQIAAFFEDLFPGGRIRRRPAKRQLPFAGWMANPKKLRKILNSGSFQPSLPAATSVEKSRSNAKRGTRNGSTRQPANQSAGDTEIYPGKSEKIIEFTLKSPVASSVKLAGDFTEWEKCPVNMELSMDGLWSAVVPLAPGLYSYRFIVDGQWCDDPQSALSVPNAFGTRNSVVHVV